MNSISVPYTMNDVRGVQKNGFTAVSTFAGCGGSSTGYRLAGFRIGAAVEFIPIAAETYTANADPATKMICKDVRDVSGREILEMLGLRKGALDVLDGSPPCASFSTAGRGPAMWGRVKKYSETKQRTDDLFAEYIRLIDEMRPRMFVAENVKGLVTGTAIGTFCAIHDALSELGYRVEARLLDAQWLGVPQTRQRVIFMGVRDDIIDAHGLALHPKFPSPGTQRAVISDACPWMTDPTTDHHNVPGASPLCDDEMGPSIERFAIGRVWERLPIGVRPVGACFNAQRMDPAKPAQTITAMDGCVSAAGALHPHFMRKLSLFELRRICSYPDDFQLFGTYQQRVERLGRSVPPLMMKAVAECAASILSTAR